MSISFSIILISFLLSFTTIRAQNNSENVEKNSLMDKIYNECNNGERLCFGSPNGCYKSRDCRILGRSFLHNDILTFDLLSPIEENQTNIYIAYSLSKTGSMGGSVAQCYLDGMGSPKFGLSYIPNNTRNIELIDNVAGIQFISAGYKDGILHCVWNRQFKTEVKGQLFDLAKHNYYVQLAKGPISENTFRRHTERISSLQVTHDVKTVKNNTLIDIYDKCNKGERLCFGSPDGCVQSQNCNILGACYLNIDKIIFDLMAQIDQKSTYIAYSLSKEATMGGSVAQCYLDDLTLPKFGLSYIPYNTRQNELVSVSGIELTSADYNDGILHCNWNRQLITEVKGETFNLANNTYYIQLAKGPMNGDQLRKHTEKIPSKDPVDLTSVGIIKEGGISPYIKWHGCLMIFAWVGCVSTGIIMARYYRDDWSSVTILGVKIWFFAHRLIMATGWVSMIASVVLIWYYKKGWSGPKAHPILGLLSVLFATLQIVNSFFRPKPGSAKRWIFDWIHWAEGNLAHILAFCAILMANILMG